MAGYLLVGREVLDERFKAFSKQQTRNIEAYNAKMDKTGGDRLPYVVIIIDELADLMMTVGREIEESITRSSLFRSVVQGKGGEYDLSVTVTQLQKPIFGGAFTVTLEAGWALVRTSDKAIVMAVAMDYEAIRSSPSGIGGAWSGPGPRGSRTSGSRAARSRARLRHNN